MTSTRTLPEVLADEGIADLTGLWPAETVEAWSRRLDPFFESMDGEARSYVGTDTLVSTGIFAELFSEPVRQLIAGIHPSALLYHCHVYEISAGQAKPHIHRDKPLGWHRDTETLQAFTPDFPSFISIFILLSPVGDDDGPFEFTPERPVDGIRAGGDVVRLVGPVGTAGIWNRSYFHRASPNRGSQRRRILKVSFQPAGLANDRIGLDEFKKAWSQLEDPSLRVLIDEGRVGTTSPLPDQGGPVAARPLAPSTTNDLTPAAATIGRVQAAGRRLLSAVAGIG